MARRQQNRTNKMLFPAHTTRAKGLLSQSNTTAGPAEALETVTFCQLSQPEGMRNEEQSKKRTWRKCSDNHRKNREEEKSPPDKIRINTCRVSKKDKYMCIYTSNCTLRAALCSPPVLGRLISGASLYKMLCPIRSQMAFETRRKHHV